MRMNRIAKSLAVAAPFLILVAAPGQKRIQSPAPVMMQTTSSFPTQSDPYADAFRGLTYTAKQKEAISKIRQDTELRKAAVEKADKLTADQKAAMLTGYTRMEYAQIYKVLTEEQKRLVGTRIHARRAAAQTQQKTQAPPQ